MRYRNKKNIYEIDGDTVKVYSENGEYVFCSDTEDIPKFNMWSWRVNAKGYVCGGSGSKKKFYHVHDLIMEKTEGTVCDHISRDKRDNRKSNLRRCSLSVNCQNRSTPSNNKSGRIGVFFDNANKRWRAVIYSGGKNNYLGSYLTFDEAKTARENAERRLDWAVT